MPGPLEGIRVCDLTIAQFGAHATMMLADMGAENRCGLTGLNATYLPKIGEEANPIAS